ncbi:hypothetical protein Ddye_011766 [Dipteronia dyeriana]|uniref:Uncharacterized protein n=1 Tax=Dipteronia dyeriana TaxID=168575 RepID=A0AAE0CHL2_9ROSI|nr:hypothetical protein Ddye_011766 [Dipteronia dyeriana]
MGVEDRAHTECWTDSLRDGRVLIMTDMWKWLHKEETQWRQKSRIKWMMEGDKNSRLFHCVANSRRMRNFIGDILFDGVRQLDLVEVRRGVLNHFKLLFRKGLDCRPTIHGLPML